MVRFPFAFCNNTAFGNDPSGIPSWTGSGYVVCRVRIRVGVRDVFIVLLRGKVRVEVGLQLGLNIASPWGRVMQLVVWYSRGTESIVVKVRPMIFSEGTAAVWIRVKVRVRVRVRVRLGLG